jgi:hypothetical protein
LSNKYTMVGLPLRALPTGLRPLTWGRTVGKVKIILQTTHPGVLSQGVYQTGRVNSDYKPVYCLHQ